MIIFLFIIYTIKIKVIEKNETILLYFYIVKTQI